MRRYQASDGSDLSYSAAGAGAPPIVFVHGWQADGRIWQPVAALLAPRHEVLVVDLRGCGANAHAPGPYDVPHFAADLGDLIAAHAGGPAVFVGHSMGAAIAQRLAIDDPGAVAGLVLVAAVPASGIPFPPRVLEFMRSTPVDATRREQWLRNLTYRELPPEVFATLAGAAAAVDAATSLEAFASWQPGDFSHELARVAAPTLVVAPAADQPMTPQYHRELVADRIANSRFVVLEEAGHYAPLERPEALASLIDSFVEGLRP